MNTFSIFQLKDTDETRAFRFVPYSSLLAAGRKPEAKYYNFVYAGELTDDMTLDGLFFTFNMERPADFRGHSLSVSDIVVFRRNGKATTYYVDSPAGFRELSDFQPTEVE